MRYQIFVYGTLLRGMSRESAMAHIPFSWDMPKYRAIYMILATIPALSMAWDAFGVNFTKSTNRLCPAGQD